MTKHEPKVGGPRGSRPEDYPGVIDVVSEVFNPGLDKWLPILFNQNNLDNLRIMLEDGKVVSHVGISRVDASLDGCTVGFGLIGCVATYEQNRGRGYATLLMQDSMEKIQADGGDVMMVSGGRGLYRRIDCADVGKQAMARIEAGSMPPAPVEVTLRPITLPDDLDFMLQAYSRKTAHFVRSREMLTTLLGGAPGQREGQSNLIVLNDGAPAAYLCLRWRRDHGVHVREYAGEPAAILDGLRAAMCENGLQRGGLSVGGWDKPLLDELARRGVSLEWGGAGGTFKILNPRRFLQTIRPLLVRRAGEAVANALSVEGTPDDVTVRLGDQSLRVEGQAVAQLFFGTLDDREKASYPASGPLRNALEKTLPLPVPMYEMNYV